MSKKANLRSEAAIAKMLDEMESTPRIGCQHQRLRRDILVHLFNLDTGEGLGTISCRDHIARRKPLKGIKAVLSGKTSVKRKAGKRK